LAFCLTSIGGVVLFSVLDIIILVIVFAALAIIMIFLLLRDLSKSYSTINEELEEMKSVLEKKEKFIADFSHRIRTPLNNFSIIIDLLLDTKPDSQQRELLETLIASTSNMVTVVNDLTVDTAREISFEPRKKINFNLITTLQNTVELFGLKNDNLLQITLSPEKSFDPYLNGDPITVKQIFLDIFNEVDLLEIKNLSINISISSKVVGKGKQNVSFVLISSSPIKLLEYDPEEPNESESLAVKLLQKLGGTISMSSTNEFSTLLFSLPFLNPVEEIKMSDAALRIKELKSENKEKKKLSDANILLVEDNPTNQKIVQISISSKVKNIDTASNGKEALDLFGTSNYDLILMDVQLPIMDGITAVQKIRELEASTSKHTPIIAITANAMLGDKEKCLSAGMDEYLSKPFQPSHLLALIEELIAR
jgi:CheY-like chemotaxis protein